MATELLDEGLERRDLTALDFVTIDSASTEDMDDALVCRSRRRRQAAFDRRYRRSDRLDCRRQQTGQSGKIRAFTNYLPGFNIPMLPRELSDDLCSLRANEMRPVSPAA